MNRRERLTRCYSNRELDRPGVYSRTGFPQNDPTYDRLKAYLRAHSELKISWSAARFETSYPTESYRESHSENFERRVTILHTPKGDLQSSQLISLKGQPGLAETYLLKNRPTCLRAAKMRRNTSRYLCRKSAGMYPLFSLPGHRLATMESWIFPWT